MHNSIKNTSAFLAGVAVIALAYAAALSTPSFAEKTVMVGGAEMYPVEEHHPERRQLEGSHDARSRGESRRPRRHAVGQRPLHRVRADQRAPSRSCPTAPSPTLLKPENKAKLTEHPDLPRRARKLTAKDLWDMVDKMGGKAELKTVNGESLRIKRVSDKHLAV